MDIIGRLVAHSLRANWRTLKTPSTTELIFRLAFLLVFLSEYIYLLDAVIIGGENQRLYAAGKLVLLLALAIFVSLLLDKNPLPPQAMTRFPLSCGQLALYAAGSRLTAPWICLLILPTAGALASSLLLSRPLLHLVSAIAWLLLVPALYMMASQLLEFPFRDYGIYLLGGVLCSWFILRWHWLGIDMTRGLISALAEPSWTLTAILLVVDICMYVSAFLMLLLQAQSERNANDRGIKRFRIVALQGKYGPLIQKDVFYFWRLLDVQAGFVLGLLFGGAIAFNPWVTVHQATGLMGIIIFFDIALVLNPFALDGKSGVERYRLLPLTGRGIVLSKNAAVAIIAFLQSLPILITGIWRLGLFRGTVLFLHWTILVGAYLALGNALVGTRGSLSISMRFFRFAAGQDVLMPLGTAVVANAAIICQIFALEYYTKADLLAAILTLLFWAMAYFVSLRMARRRLQQCEALMFPAYDAKTG